MCTRLSQSKLRSSFLSCLHRNQSCGSAPYTILLHPGANEDRRQDTTNRDARVQRIQTNPNRIAKTNDVGAHKTNRAVARRVAQRHGDPRVSLQWCSNSIRSSSSTRLPAAPLCTYCNLEKLQISSQHPTTVYARSVPLRAPGVAKQTQKKNSAKRSSGIHTSHATEVRHRLVARNRSCGICVFRSSRSIRSSIAFDHELF